MLVCGHGYGRKETILCSRLEVACLSKSQVLVDKWIRQRVTYESI